MASVRKRAWNTNGKERTAWIVDYFDQQGVRRLKTFDRKKAADDYLTTVKEEVRRGVHTADSVSLTVSELAERWIAQGKRERLERSTICQRESHVKHHIGPFLGSTKVSRLTAPAVREFTNGLREEDRSPAMVKKVLRSLSGMLNYGEHHGLVAQNVARAVKLRQSSRDKRPAMIPAKEEIKAILDKAEGRWRPLLVTAVFTGMRASELRGLAWENVDFPAKLIRIRERADPWGTMGAPKSAAGDRDIPMAPIVLNTLRQWRLDQRQQRAAVVEAAIAKGRVPPKPPAADRVFANGRGNVENHANIYNRGFAPFQVAAGLYSLVPVAGKGGKAAIGDDGAPKMKTQAKYSLHDLRHFAASLFIEQGLPPKKVQELMGHASIQTTFDVYGHLFPTPHDDQKAMEQIQARLLG